MLEDKWLVWKLQMGSDEALQQIYEKYKDDLLALALALAPDRATAEDALHDAFVAFAEFAPRLQLRGCLKSYLCSCVANHLRNRGKAKPQHTVGLEQAPLVAASQDRPDHRWLPPKSPSAWARPWSNCPICSGKSSSCTCKKGCDSRQ